MCAVCFTGFQAIPVAAAAGRAWWVKRTALWGAGHTVESNDETESGDAESEFACERVDAELECKPEFEPAEGHLALA